MILNLVGLENRIHNVERAIEIACQLEIHRSGDDSFGELVIYALDNAHREASELRKFFQGRKSST